MIYFRKYDALVTLYNSKHNKRAPLANGNKKEPGYKHVVVYSNM